MGNRLSSMQAPGCRSLARCSRLVLRGFPLGRSFLGRLLFGRSSFDRQLLLSVTFLCSRFFSRLAIGGRALSRGFSLGRLLLLLR